MLTMEEEIRINDPLQAASRQILTPEALAFLTKLQNTFNPVRLELLEVRKRRQQHPDCAGAAGGGVALKTESPVQLIQAAQRPFRARMGGDRLYSTRYDQSRDRKVIEGERQYRTLSSQKYFQ